MGFIYLVLIIRNCQCESQRLGSRVLRPVADVVSDFPACLGAANACRTPPGGAAAGEKAIKLSL